MFYLAIDIHRMYQNVRILAQRRNIEIRILEENLGVELGYFARAENKELLPMVGTVAKIAEILNCTSDMLIYADISQFTDADFYIHDFMQKLYRETQDGTIAWSKAGDGCYAAQILTDKDVCLSGVSTNSSWGKLKIWMEDREEETDTSSAEAPLEDTVSAEPLIDSETEPKTTAEEPSITSITADTPADEETEDKPKKKEYVVYDVKKFYRDTYVHKHTKDTALLIKRIAEQPIDHETLALVKQFLEESTLHEESKEQPQGSPIEAKEPSA